MDEQLVRLLINYIDRKIEYELAYDKVKPHYDPNTNRWSLIEAERDIADYFNSINDKE